MSWREMVVIALAAIAGLAAVAGGVAVIWLTIDGTLLFDARYGGDRHGEQRRNTVFESVFLIAVAAVMILSVLVPLWLIVARLHRPGRTGE